MVEELINPIKNEEKKDSSHKLDEKKEFLLTRNIKSREDVERLLKSIRPPREISLLNYTIWIFTLILLGLGLWIYFIEKAEMDNVNTYFTIVKNIGEMGLYSKLILWDTREIFFLKK